MSFVEMHGLASPERRARIAEIAGQVKADGLETIRFAFPDQHGILRGKTLVAEEAIKALDSGVMVTSTLIAKDTAHRTVFPVFNQAGGHSLEGLKGGGDFVLVADPTTFRLLPWSDKSGWVLCDAYLCDGRLLPYATRTILRRALEKLEPRGWDMLAGIEVEFHIFRLEDPKLAPADALQPGPAPAVSLISRGYQYLTEQRFDAIEPVLDLIRRNTLGLGLPLRSIEIEFGPSQVECTFKPTSALASADLMVLFRAAVKQVCQRAGYHATFMCRPGLPNAFSSGWHLHQSLCEGGRNLFAAGSDADPMSGLARAYMGGLLAHARPAAAFSTPTINGYKRYRPYSLAPDRAVWARDNRGVMVRALGGGTDPATRLENRVGEPMANPYLYIASQLVAGLDGIDRKLDPGAPAETPYDTLAPLLPKSLAEAVALLRADPFFRVAFGAEFVDYYTRLKTTEIERFQAEVTDWEQREYFELF